MMLSEAIEAVGQMLSGYANGSPSKAYIGTMAALLCQYPRMIATACANPLKGVVTTTKFIPTVADVVAWCEAQVATMRSIVTYDERSIAQLRERAEWDRLQAEPSEDRAAVVAKIRADMAAAGMPMFDDKSHMHGETAETVKAKYNITDALWDATPDAR